MVGGIGIKNLVENIPKATSPDTRVRTRDDRWATVGSIIEQFQRIEHRHHTWLERLQDASVKPLTGGMIALGVLICAFLVIRFIGESLIGYLLDPLFDTLWAPVVMALSNLLGGSGFIHDIVVGRGHAKAAVPDA